MKIVLNGEVHDVSARTLDAVLVEIGFDGLLATAVNGDFVPQLERKTRVLKDHDRVEVLAPMQGG
ncbi:sulfur carrier protein [Roseibium hamelinense]|uniref:Sulfur carrier protein n=1 Tax=Roseibium hamelinense TaxID=150831 RepID=A0A562SNK1_9HYPH|nr:sulfur carrier protein ThiS [Roseibium hamelinense]MTI44313.1 sulfur carrier protein ThiS [Roseibium hamelinense]TWI82911.1 sulfur carrier protein [Roseibium hamelinense]